MNPGHCVGHLCPLAATLGAGALLAVGSPAPVVASPRGPDNPSVSADSAEAGNAASRRAHRGNGNSVPAPTRSITDRPVRRPLAAAIPVHPAAGVSAATVTRAESRTPRPGGREIRVNPAAAPAGASGAVSAAAHGIPLAGVFRGLATFFGNPAPTLNPIQTGQSGNVVSGELRAGGAGSAALRYTVVTNPARGTVTVGSDGSYRYVADTAVAATGTLDSFRVTVDAAGSGLRLQGLAGLFNILTFGLFSSRGRPRTATATVTVTVTPFDMANRAPTGTARVDGVEPVTGVVTGAVTSTDADGDPLTYTGSSVTAKGAVVVTAGGAFTYTPTAAARLAAGEPTATADDRQDGFVVTISDGRGGTAGVAVTVPVSPAPVPSAQLTAFPGAEGFGAYATGGRGGSVVYVTNLNANGPGSLQWAIDQPGPRYILFKVSGVIDAQIHLTHGDVTIAGQTSPGGITLRGLVTDESPYRDQDVRAPAAFAENWILQHIRMRPGLDGPSEDGLRMRYTRNAIVDHVSVGNAVDEAIEISYSHDITVQNTLIAETVGGHSFYGGILMNYSNPAYGFGLDNISLHHNIFNRIEGRLPEGSRESLAAADSYMNLEISDNLYWDPRFYVALGLTTNVVTDSRGNPYPIYWNLNAVNNYFRTANLFPYGMFDDSIMRTPLNRLYVSGNKMSRYPSRLDYELFYCCNDFASVTPDTSAQRAQKLLSRHPFPSITYTATDLLPTVLLNTAGAWPRDPMDVRLLQSIASNTISSAPINTNPAGDALLPAYRGTAPVAPVDTDNDGMPDAWEIARRLDPNVANANGTQLSSIGYTDLEVYLQGLSAGRIIGWAG